VPIDLICPDIAAYPGQEIKAVHAGVFGEAVLSQGRIVL
jgi:hypothetical protein